MTRRDDDGSGPVLPELERPRVEGGVSRRRFLEGTALAAGALLMGACTASDDETALQLGLTDDGFEDHPDDIVQAPLGAFPLGIASGDVSATSAILWTRYTGTRPLYLAVYEAIAGKDVRVGLFDVLPDSGGFVKIDVVGLTAGARHRFVFLERLGDVVVARSPIGRFRAAFDRDALETLRFGASACTYNGRSMATLERAGERTDLDLFCLLGDTTYNDGAKSRADFRAKWAQNLGTAGYRALRASTSLLATWDDHEITNDYNPEKIDPAVLDQGVAAFFEHLPIRRNGQVSTRVWRRLRWGLTAEFFVLDSRSERKPSTRRTASAQYLSRTQMDWLKAGLADSPAVFKVILNSVPITDFPGLYDLIASDRWEGYPSARREILSFIDNESIDGVLWVSGDFHLGSCGRVSPSGYGSKAIEVLAGPGAQLANPLLGTLYGNPQFDFLTGVSNTTRFELDPIERRVVVAFVDGGGATIGQRTYQL